MQFQIGSWSYQSQLVRLVVDSNDVFLCVVFICIFITFLLFSGDFYDNQEWLLVMPLSIEHAANMHQQMEAIMRNGTMQYLGNESFSMVQIALLLRRQSFYYVFNLVFPTTLVRDYTFINNHYCQRFPWLP